MIYPLTIKNFFLIVSNSDALLIIILIGTKTISTASWNCINENRKKAKKKEKGKENLPQWTFGVTMNYKYIDLNIQQFLFAYKITITRNCIKRV